MHVESYGQGSEVYIGLHGWSGSHKTFLPLLEYLPARARLLAPDLPGHGCSPVPQRWSLGEVTREIAELITSLETPPVTIVGSCTGGILGLFAAQRLGDRVQRIVLIDPFAYVPWYFNLFVAPRLGRIGRYAYLTTFANPVGRWLTNASLRRHRVRQTNLTTSFSAVNHEVIYTYLKLFSEAGQAEQFRGVTAQVEIVYGERTFAAVKESARRWRAVWPQAHAWEIKGAGHLPIREATAELSRIIFGIDQA